MVIWASRLSISLFGQKEFQVVITKNSWSIFIYEIYVVVKDKSCVNCVRLW